MDHKQILVYNVLLNILLQIKNLVNYNVGQDVQFVVKKNAYNVVIKPTCQMINKIAILAISLA